MKQKREPKRRKERRDQDPRDKIQVTKEEKRRSKGQVRVRAEMVDNGK